MVLLLIAGVFSMWPVELLNYDLYHDYRNAVGLVESLNLPKHGSVASFGVFNPPGIGWLLAFGVLVFPVEPVLAVHLVATILSLCTLWGLWLLASKRLGPAAALWVLLLYAVSSTGAYFFAELRPRAHPFFLVWILYFLDLWIVERKGWAIGWVLFLQAFGMYWMLEITPLLLGIAGLWMWFRPRIEWKALGVSVLMAGLLWAPYLHLQVERNFHDLQYLLIKLEPAHRMGLVLHELQIENGIRITHGERVHEVPPVDPSLVEEKVEKEWPAFVARMMDSRASILYTLFPQLVHPVLFYLLLGGLLGSLFLLRKPFSSLQHWKFPGKLDPGTQVFTIWVLTGLICGVILFVLTRGKPPHVVENRFLWLWPLFVLILVGRCFRVSFPKWKGISRVFLVSLCLGLFPNSTGYAKILQFLEYGASGPPLSDLRQSLDFVARTIREKNLPPRIGYDIAFVQWVPGVYRIDGVSSTGLVHDLVLERRYGIRNLNGPPFKVSPEDVLRIVEHGSEHAWRQDYLDLSGYPPMILLYQNVEYSVLGNPAYFDLENSGPGN